ncbi:MULTISPECIES: hypothetical protein [Pseudomonas]|uniref:hypothetical protein n=1 Tax=Pseudomonas TaxID=286 RepID=UPI000C9AD412|nr:MULTISPECIES: hypothetical protein [Pseudomonas]AXK57308.1 hypothetical protein DWF74_29585 [Pseudomonas protegens]MDP4571663.1 hypothetical protein [Pseudomonas sp. LPH60]PNG30304.1 hypothetical protein A1348_23685 [Pseudomonas protegens]RXU65309.1 hypothetical protein CW358_13850 [Pseudomonas protegens]BCT33147.1 hypothetical protein PproGo58_26420 [Pseudomonas protegens]
MYLKPFSMVQRGLQALLVCCLCTSARLLTRVSIRLYVRGLLSAVEIRFLLGFSAAITRASLRVAIA